MRLAYREAGEGTPVVLLHGLFGSARNLGLLARSLAATHRVISMDLRNHGDSDHDPAVSYPILAADVAEAMDVAGLPAAAVLGHSMGGKVAMYLAVTDPARVTRLVVADIAPITYPSHFGAYVRAMLALPTSATRPEADAFLSPAVPDPAVRAFLLQSHSPGRGWRIGLAEIAASLPTIEAWQDGGTSYTGPTLFITGERSDYVPSSAYSIIQRLFPAACVTTIPNAGHWLHAEQPTLFNAAVTSFLRG